MQDDADAFAKEDQVNKEIKEFKATLDDIPEEEIKKKVEEKFGTTANSSGSVVLNRARTKTGGAAGSRAPRPKKDKNAPKQPPSAFKLFSD
eukprot:gene17917-5643_t